MKRPKRVRLFKPVKCEGFNVDEKTIRTIGRCKHDAIFKLTYWNHSYSEKKKDKGKKIFWKQLSYVCEDHIVDFSYVGTKTIFPTLKGYIEIKVTN